MAGDDDGGQGRVREGDLVLLSDGKGARHLLKAAGDMRKVGGLGVIDGSRLLEARFGDVFEVGRFRGYILRPTPRDLAEMLRGKAQTIIPKDSSIIVMYCGVRPGSRVLEVGAGSGGLTVALCEAVGPGGRVVSWLWSQVMAAGSPATPPFSEVIGVACNDTWP